MPFHSVTYTFGPATVINPAAIPQTLGSTQGWTELYYDPADAADAVALTRGLLLASVRRPLLTPGWQIKRVRIARIPGIRAARPVNLAPNDGVGTYPVIAPATRNDEQAYDAVTILIASQLGKNRTLSMRGIGSDVVSAGGQYLAPGSFTDRLGPWADALKSFAIRYAIGGLSATITMVATSTNGLLLGTPAKPVVFYTGPAGFSVGDVIHISNVVGMTGINGQWTLDSDAVATAFNGINGFAFRLRQKRGRFVSGGYQDGGRFVKQVFDYDPIDTVTPGEGTSRRTGSGPFRRRGRRSRRPL